MTTPQSWNLGNMKLRHEPPDVLWMEMEGTVDGSSTGKVAGIFRQICEKQPVYLICDFTKLVAMTPEVRAEVGKNIKAEWIQGCAYINASLVTMMAVKAMNALMFLVGKTTFKGLFVKSEPEARAAIAKLRRERQAA